MAQTAMTAIRVPPKTSARGRQRTARFAGRQAEGVLSRSQFLDRERRRHPARSRSRPTAATRSASRTASGSWVYGEELGQTTAIWWSPDSTKVGVLPLRREPGEGLLPADDADGDSERARRRGVSEGRRAESDRRSVRLRRRRRHRRRRSTCATASRSPIFPPTVEFANDDVGHYVYRVVARRQRAVDEPHEPAAEHHGVRRAAARRRQVPRDRARGMARPAGSSNSPQHAASWPTTSASSGSRSATASRTTTCTTSAGS